MRWTSVVGGAVALLAIGLGASPVGAQTTTTTTTTPEQTTTTTPPAQTTTPTTAPEQTTTTTTGPPVVAQQPAAEKVTYCHRTASVSNPYVAHTTAVDSIIKQGHGSHTGPIFPETGPDGKWGDIIPAFEYGNGQQFPGLNWPAGQAVIDAGCVVHETVEPPEETTTTSTSSTTTTTTTTTTTPPTTIILPGTTTTRPGATTTTRPGATTTTMPTAAETTTTTTTLAGVTTTSAGPGGATGGPTTPPSTGSSPPTFATAPLTPPPVYALAAGETLPDPPPQVTAFVLDAHSKIVVLGVLSPDETRQLFRELAERHLAHTGSETGPLVLVALLALVIGSGLLALSWWRREQPDGDHTP